MELPKQVKLVFGDTPEKFQPYAAEIVPPLLALLEARNELEREIWARSIRLREEKAAAGISPHQTIPAEEELWEEFHRRCLELARPCCTENMLKGGPAGSFGKPAKYDYLFDSPDPAVCFTMKSPKKAVVSIRNPVSHAYGYRFTLRPSQDGWKVDGAECALGEQGVWGVEHSL